MFSRVLPRFNLMIISFFLFYLSCVFSFFFIYLQKKIKNDTHTQAENICRLIQWRVVPSLSLFRYMIVFLINNNLMMIYPTKNKSAIFFFHPLALFNSFAVVDKETWINLKQNKHTLIFSLFKYFHDHLLILPLLLPHLLLFFLFSCLETWPGVHMEKREEI